MRKRLVITAAALMAAAITASATNDTISAGTPAREIDEVEVTAARATKVAQEKLRVITTIRREEIRSMPAQSLQELLDYLPGIDIRSRGANGVQADISMRGGTFDQVVVMLNGVNITETQTGHFNLDIPIDLDAVDRIEVLQGTSMSIFGLSAFAGAINIITGESEENSTTAAIEGGDHGLLSAQTRTSAHGGWAARLRTTAAADICTTPTTATATRSCRRSMTARARGTSTSKWAGS